MLSVVQHAAYHLVTWQSYTAVTMPKCIFQ